MSKKHVLGLVAYIGLEIHDSINST